MPQKQALRDYIEWVSDPAPEAEKLRGSRDCSVESLFDAVIRQRMGEFIAEAARRTKKAASE
jgi:hypothetical protein